MVLYKGFQKVLLCLMLVTLLMTMLVPAVAGAETVGRWEQAADDIDKLMDEAFEYYLAGDTSNAYKSVSAGYFNVYEVTGMERQTMSYISGPRKNAMELQFSTCKGAVKKSNEDIETQTAVRTELNKLKTMIREDANKLAIKDGEPTSVTKYYYHGELVASDPYADLAGDPNAAVKYASWTEAWEAMEELLDTAHDAYIGKDYETAQDNLNNAIYSVYENSGFSYAVFNKLSVDDRKAMDAELDALVDISISGKYQKTAFERQLKKVKSVISKKAAALDALEAEEATAAAEEAAAQAAEAATADGATASNDLVIFTGAFGIIVREGLEAILVIAAIIAYLVKAGATKHMKSVYIGSLVGIACSFLAALGLTLLKNAVGDAFGAQAQEIMEGCTALVAVCVLFYVSNWMLSKSESKAWTNYIDSKVENSVATGSGFALSFAAFLSVFREGAEVVLFYQPMLVEDGNPAMVWAGFGVGCLVLAVVWVIIRYFSVRLPLKPFFTFTSIFMAVMCVSFVGSAVKEFAEGGLLDVTAIPWMWTENDVTDALGLYPFAEPIFAQLLLVIALVATFIIGHYRNKLTALQVDYKLPQEAILSPKALKKAQAKAGKKAAKKASK